MDGMMELFVGCGEMKVYSESGEPGSNNVNEAMVSPIVVSGGV
jgi:hypothetical protein